MPTPQLFYKSVGLIRPGNQTVRWEFTPGTEPNESVFACSHAALQAFRDAQEIPGDLRMVRDDGTEIVIKDLFFRDSSLILEDREPKVERNWYSFRLLDKRVLWSYGVVAKRYNVTTGESGYLKNTVKSGKAYKAFEILDDITAATLTVAAKGEIKLGFTATQVVKKIYINRLQQVIDNVEYECVKPNVAMRDILERAGMQIGIKRDGSVVLWAKQEKEFLGAIDLGTKISGGEKSENMRLFRPKFLDVYFPVDVEVGLEYSVTTDFLDPVIPSDGKNKTATQDANSGAKDGEWITLTTAAADWNTTVAKILKYAWKQVNGDTIGQWTDGPVSNITGAGLTDEQKAAARSKRVACLMFVYRAFRVSAIYTDQFLPFRTVTCTIDSTGNRSKPFAVGDYWERVKITGDLSGTNPVFKNYDARIPHSLRVADAETGLIIFSRAVGKLIDDSKVAIDATGGIDGSGSSFILTISHAKHVNNTAGDFLRFRYDLTKGTWDKAVAGDKIEKFAIVDAAAAYTIFASDLTALEKLGATNDYTNYSALARRALNEKWKFLQMVSDVESASYKFAGWHNYDVGPGVSRIVWNYPFPTTELLLNDKREVTKGRGKLVKDKQNADKAKIDSNARKV